VLLALALVLVNEVDVESCETAVLLTVALLQHAVSLALLSVALVLLAVVLALVPCGAGSLE
jgi:hypothetical protein